MFGFNPFFNQPPHYYTDHAPRRPAHAQTPYGYYPRQQQYDEDEYYDEEEYHAAQQRAKQQEVLRRRELQRQQEILRRKELIRQQELLQQQELQRQRALELQRRKEQQQRQQQYNQFFRSQQQRYEESDEEDEVVAPPVNKDALATKIQSLFRGWQVRRQNMLPKLKNIVGVEREVDTIIQRNAAISALPLDGAGALPSDTQYVGSVPRQFLAFELELTAKLISLDSISCGPSPIVRAARKALATKIETVLAKVDALKGIYAYTPAPAVVSTDTEEAVDEGVEFLSKIQLFDESEEVPTQQDKVEEVQESSEVHTQPEVEKSQEAFVQREEEAEGVREKAPAQSSASQPEDEDMFIGALFDDVEEDTPSLTATPTSTPSTDDSSTEQEVRDFEDLGREREREDEWVYMDEHVPQPTPSTQPQLSSTQEEGVASVRHIPQLKQLCYSLCSNLIRQAIVVQ